MTARRGWLALAAAGVIVFLAACTLRGGLRDDRPSGDLLAYERFAERMVGGELPYRDFFVEYPPGALPAFLVPSLAPDGHYRLAFGLLMALCGVAALVLVALVLARVGASPLRRALALGFVALAPAALGPVYLQRFDLWPTALALAALAALVCHRQGVAAGLLGAATAAKVFPAILLPLALLRGGREAVRRNVTLFAGALLLVTGAFALLAPTGLGYSLWIQARRGLQIESLGASFLLAADRLGLYEPEIVAGRPGSRDLAGPLAEVVASVSTLLQLAALAAVVLLASRTRLSGESLLLAAAAALAGIVAFGKVLSPQFLVWLVPFVPLVAGAAGLAASALLGAALLLSQLWLVDVVTPFDLDAEVWLVLVRNLLLVGVYAVLAERLRRDAASQIAVAPAPQSTKNEGRLACRKRG